MQSVMTALALCISWRDVATSARHVAIDAYHTLSPHVPALEGIYGYLNGISQEEEHLTCAICSLPNPEVL